MSAAKVSTPEGFSISPAADWLSQKRKLDEIDSSLWRVHDDLYDLSDFMERHPGGAQLLELTRGTDITEAYEVSHFFNKGANNQLLEKFHVRKCDTPRRSPFTFHKDGFYQKLKARAQEALKETGIGPTKKMLIVQDGLVLLFHVTLALAIKSGSPVQVLLAGIYLGMSTTSSHNFFHQKDNWRRYYWDISMFNSTDWRVTHMLSHHLHTNTYQDVEITAMFPFVDWMSNEGKHWVHKYLSTFYVYLLFLAIAPIQFTTKAVSGRMELVDCMPLVHLAAFWMYSPLSPGRGFLAWLAIHSLCGFWLVFTSLIATHHTPVAYHDGDTPHPNNDWGLRQLDSTRDVSKSPNLLLVATTLGDHLLHHLFPTVDQSKLWQLYPALQETCREFGMECYQFEPAMKMWRGMHQQLARVKTNTYEDRKAMRAT